MTDLVKKSDIPLVVTAFGTTENAFSTYEKMDGLFKTRFPRNPLLWAYSSRMVKHAMKQKKNLDLKDPLEIMADLAKQGHEWAVLQSLHLICGHEFDRLVSQGQASGLRVSMGRPLLTSQTDYVKAANALAGSIPAPETGIAAVLVGHGTDHPAWSAYPAFEDVLRQRFGAHVFAGVVEGYPEKEDILARVKAAGFKRICLIPFMLVAGVHFKEDLTCEPDSWQKCFENAGIRVDVVDQGIGGLSGIQDIFCCHMEAALDIILL
ncbi:MAG: sirohydrochlorin cobaltochelatase [Desulfobacter sp.]|nr:sirohydrochlorin cobaltochelatase [Desulfobacter sp.]